MHIAKPIGLLLAAMIFMPVQFASAWTGSLEDSRVSTLSFKVLRDGEPFGTHRTQVRREGGSIVVETQISARLNLGFLTLYRFSHHSREEWRDGRLVSLDAFTDDDGKVSKVNAWARAGGLEVDGPGGRLMLPADTMPTTFWHSAIMTASHLLDVQTGRLAKVEIHPGGAERVSLGSGGARQFSVSGDLNMDVWFGPDGGLAGTQFQARGFTITYQRDRADLAAR